LTDDDPMRALVSPFVHPDDFDPIFGRCSRCGGDAILIETGWHHDGKGCDPRKAEAAQFIPDAPEG
jgi:hypothetical protein